MDPSLNWGDLYKNWLENLREKAKLRRGQHLEKVYERAANAIVKAKITTETPNELTKLSGVGKKTAEILTKFALKHCKDHGLSEDWAEPPSTTRAAPEAPKKSTRNYVPKFGATPYHVLCGIRQLERHDSHASGFGRDAILRHIKPKLMENNGGSYQKLLPSLTPAFTQLTTHGYIFARSRQYYLEDKGRDLADKFLGVEKDVRREQGSTVSSDLPCPAENIPLVGRLTLPGDFKSSIWESKDYTLRLLLDNREVSTAENRNGFQEALEALGIPIVVLPLSVGDCCWVVEHKTSRRRAILDTIIERKRLDDLVSSIMDGRFQEQKQRLDKSSLPHVVYLVENTAGDAEFREKHQQRINTAVSQVVIQNQFHYQETESQAETVAYFGQMMEAIKKTLEEKPITIIHPNILSFKESMEKAVESRVTESFAVDYDSFLEATQKSRNRTVAEIFMLMLMAIRGISAEKAKVIQSLYKTPRILVEAYARTPSRERPTMLYDATADLPTRRQIDKDISAQVSQQWSKGVSKVNLDEPAPQLRIMSPTLGLERPSQTYANEDPPGECNYAENTFDGEESVRSIVASPQPSMPPSLDELRYPNFFDGQERIDPSVNLVCSKPLDLAPFDSSAHQSPQQYTTFDRHPSASTLDSSPVARGHNPIIELLSDSPVMHLKRKAPLDSSPLRAKRPSTDDHFIAPAPPEPITIDLLSMDSVSDGGCDIIDLC